jgi:hypothetical protein
MAIRLDASNPYLQRTGFGTPFGGGSYSVGGWINSVSQARTDVTGMFADANSAFCCMSETYNNSGKLGFLVNASTHYASTHNTPSGPNHVLFVVNGTSGTVYLDGVSSGVTIAAPSGMSTTVWLGTAGPGSSDFTYGDYAEWAVWTTALSGTDAADLAGGRYPNLVQPGSLHAYWSFLSGALTDASGNGYTWSGTVNTTAWHPTMNSGGGGGAWFVRNTKRTYMSPLLRR